MPEQVQDFYPTPGTLATCMWYTGLDPRTMEPVFVPKTPHDKALQRALMQWRKPQNRALVLEALHKTGREDLIGYGKECLIRPGKAPERPYGGKAAGKAPDRGAGKAPDRRGKSSRSGGKSPAGKAAPAKAAARKSAKPVRKAGWAKPKAKKQGKKS